jgi:hypothetical protein
MYNVTKSTLQVAGGQSPHSGELLAINAQIPGPSWHITAAPRFGSTAIHSNKSVEGEVEAKNGGKVIKRRAV